MTTENLNDMQRYLVEEEAEKWQEGRISRREFLRRVTLIVGSAAAASSVLVALGCNPNPSDTAQPAATAEATATAGATPAAEVTPATEATAAAPEASPTAGATDQPQGSTSPNHVPENDPDVKAEMVKIPTSDPAVTLLGYLAAPAVPSMSAMSPPGILVIHENRGLTDHIKDVVRRLAKARYVALAVDLVSRAGGTDAHPDDAERTGIIGQLQPDQVIADLSAGLDYLKSSGQVSPDRLGVTGFCFGGGYAWRMATKRQDLKAAVPFYGPNPPLEDVPNIKAAVLGIYGSEDTRITGQVPALEEALKQAGVTYEIKIYEGAQHAFHNDTGQRYHPEAAQDAWQRTLDWFGKHL